MRISSFLLLTTACVALAACADANPVSSRAPVKRSDVYTQREVWVEAQTYWTLSSGGSGSGGYVKGLATPVGSGSSYVMGDVEADGSGAEFVEAAGYTGQLDAFRYNGSCTFKWYADFHQVSTAGTIYLANYPNASTISLRITCSSS